MNKQGKIWGETCEIFSRNNVSVNRISVNKGSCCSKHKHVSKYNIFFVESGKIKVQEWKKDYNLVDETILSPGESCCVTPDNFHKFIGLEDSIVYEIYFVKLLDNDIIREDVGSKS